MFNGYKRSVRSRLSAVFGFLLLVIGLYMLCHVFVLRQPPSTNYFYFLLNRIGVVLSVHSVLHGLDWLNIAVFVSIGFVLFTLLVAIFPIKRKDKAEVGMAVSKRFVNFTEYIGNSIMWWLLFVFSSFIIAYIILIVPCSDMGSPHPETPNGFSSFETYLRCLDEFNANLAFLTTAIFLVFVGLDCFGIFPKKAINEWLSKLA